MKLHHNALFATLLLIFISIPVFSKSLIESKQTANYLGTLTKLQVAVEGSTPTILTDAAIKKMAEDQLRKSGIEIAPGSDFASPILTVQYQQIHVDPHPKTALVIEIELSNQIPIAQISATSKTWAILWEHNQLEVSKDDALKDTLSKSIKQEIDIFIRAWVKAKQSEPHLSSQSKSKPKHSGVTIK